MTKKLSFISSFFWSSKFCFRFSAFLSLNVHIFTILFFLAGRPCSILQFDFRGEKVFLIHEFILRQFIYLNPSDYWLLFLYIKF